MDKHSIKNVLFTKKFPTYTPDVQIDGHKVFHCVDCGDKYLLQSSFDYHVNRKSLQITYNCRFCKKSLIFLNRCNLLSHIRSHAFRTATINVSDLTIEPIKLPISQTIASSQKFNEAENQTTLSKTKNSNAVVICAECNKFIPAGACGFKERAKHYNQPSDKTYTCPICLFTSPTLCGLEAHHKIHSMHTPCYCPECGKLLFQSDVTYPYNRHKCKGFKLIKATTRVQCTVKGCSPFHPQNFAKHMFKHIKINAECCICHSKSADGTRMRHKKGCFVKRKLHQTETHTKATYSCEVCNFVPKTLQEAQEHVKKSPHNCPVVFLCLKCKAIFKNPLALNKHHKQSECNGKSASNTVVQSPEKQNNNDSKLYRVVKKCDQCKRGFTYRCKFDDIKKLPVDCPFGCALPKKIKCCICGKKISVDWRQIKAHYSICHKEHRCLDVSVKIQRLNMKKYLQDIQKRSVSQRNNIQTSITIEKSVDPPTYPCKLCGIPFSNKHEHDNHFSTVHKNMVPIGNVIPPQE